MLCHKNYKKPKLVRLLVKTSNIHMTYFGVLCLNCGDGVLREGIATEAIYPAKDRQKILPGYLMIIWKSEANNFLLVTMPAGRRGSIGSVCPWHASGPEFDPHVWHILLWRLGHENISTAILPLLLIQEEQLSVTGKRMSIKYW